MIFFVILKSLINLKGFLLIDLPYADIVTWYKKAYTTETEIVPKSLLCDDSYFQIYLTWMNFVF